MKSCLDKIIDNRYVSYFDYPVQKNNEMTQLYNNKQLKIQKYAKNRSNLIEETTKAFIKKLFDREFVKILVLEKVFRNTYKKYSQRAVICI